MQVWVKVRPRLWWLMPLCFALGAFAVRELYLGATQGAVYVRRGYHRYVTVQEDPTTFWLNVAMDAAFLLLLLGVPIRMAWKLRTAKLPPSLEAAVQVAWEERLAKDLGRKLWWILPLLAFIVIWFSGAIYVHVTRGWISSGVERVSLESDALRFWTALLPVLGVLAFCVGMPLWVACRIAALKLNRFHSRRGP